MNFAQELNRVAGAARLTVSPEKTRGDMNNIAEHGWPGLRGAVRFFDSSASLTWRRWKIRLWIVLLWLFGIPLSTVGFLSMLFWAYGVDM